MDRKYQDVHYLTRFEEVVYRHITVVSVKFTEQWIDVEYLIEGKPETCLMTFPKIRGSKIVID